MPRTKKTFLISIDATINVTAGYELEAFTLDDAIKTAENLFTSELDINLEQCHDAGFRVQDIDTTCSEVEG